MGECGERWISHSSGYSEDGINTVEKIARKAGSPTSKCYSDVLLDSLSLLNGIKRMFTQLKDTRSSHSRLKGF